MGGKTRIFEKSPYVPSKITCTPLTQHYIIYYIIFLTKAFKYIQLTERRYMDVRTVPIVVTTKVASAASCLVNNVVNV